MTSKAANTRRSVAQDINADLNHIKRTLQYDVERVAELIEAIKVWSDKAPEDQYDGEIAERVNDLLGLTNNSGWIAYLQGAIRIASRKAGNW